jgi:putative membrane protein
LAARVATAWPIASSRGSTNSDKVRNLFGRRSIQCSVETAIAADTEDPMKLRIVATTLAAVLMASGAAVAQSAKPNDAQIAHIAYTAGLADIANAEQAMKKSKNKDVRAFAQNMLQDHKAVNDKALALVKKLNVTPQDNDTSKAIAKGQADKRAELAKLNGAAFDKAYAANEVAYHKTVNGALQSTLIPSSSNAELKSLLETGLKIFQGHQQHAEHVAAELK